MLYFVFENRSGEIIAYIDSDTENIKVSKGYSVRKADAKDIFKKRFGEFDFPDPYDLWKEEINADTDIQKGNK